MSHETLELKPETISADSHSSGAPVPPEETGRAHSQPNMKLVIALCLVAITFVLYEPTLHNGFVNFDDPNYISQNAHVAQGLTRNNIKWAFATTEESNWHPITWISYMATAQIFGMKPVGFH